MGLLYHTQVEYDRHKHQVYAVHPCTITPHPNTESTTHSPLPHSMHIVEICHLQILVWHTPSRRQWCVNTESLVNNGNYNANRDCWWATTKCAILLNEIINKKSSIIYQLSTRMTTTLSPPLTFSKKLTHFYPLT